MSERWRGPVRIVRVPDAHQWAHQIQRPDGTSVDVGLFSSELWAEEYAHGRGWRVLRDRPRVDVIATADAAG